jgi:hypothetical protein
MVWWRDHDAFSWYLGGSAQIEITDHNPAHRQCEHKLQRAQAQASTSSSQHKHKHKHKHKFSIHDYHITSLQAIGPIPHRLKTTLIAI